MTVEQKTKSELLSDTERSLIEYLINEDLKKLTGERLELARGLSSRFVESVNRGNIRPGLLKATYWAVLNGQVSVDGILPKGPAICLKSRQKEIVRLLTQGNALNQIAEIMALTNPAQVNGCLNNIMGSWAVENLFQIVAIAARDRILE